MNMHSSYPHAYESVYVNDYEHEFIRYLNDGNSPPNENEDLNNKSKLYAITSATTGSVSFICSMTIVCIILRSHAGLSKTYHRLLLGMCIGDMISSLVYMMSTAVMPTDVNYYVWNARGNQASCDFQGFMAMFGIVFTLGYNCSLSLFYLAVVKYKKKDDYIRKKMEPWLHGVPIVIASGLAIAGLVSQVYNADLVNCFVREYRPSHCEGIEEGITPHGYDIPCGRGSKNYDIFYYILLVAKLGIIPGITFGSMTMMYREVLKTEKKMDKYRINVQTNRRAQYLQRENRNLDNIASGHDGGEGDLPNRNVSRVPSGFFTSISNRLSSAIRRSPDKMSARSMKNTRRVMYRALAYAMAYLATYLFPITVEIEILANHGKLEFSSRIYLAYFFHPLQGLFNFMVFIYPRVVSAKSSKTSISWRQAFIRALLYRGIRMTRLKRSTSICEFKSRSLCPCLCPCTKRRKESITIEAGPEIEEIRKETKEYEDSTEKVFDSHQNSESPAKQVSFMLRSDEKQGDDKEPFLGESIASQGNYEHFAPLLGQKIEEDGVEEEEKSEIEPNYLFSFPLTKKNHACTITKGKEILPHGALSSTELADEEGYGNEEINVEATDIHEDCVEGNAEFLFPIKLHIPEKSSHENGKVSSERLDGGSGQVIEVEKPDYLTEKCKDGDESIKEED